MPAAAAECTEREARWALGLVPHLGGVALAGLLEAFGSARGVWEAPRDRLRAVPGVGPATAFAIAAFPWAKNLRDDQRRAAEAGLAIIVWGDADYPVLLNRIASPPPVLYLRGHLSPEDAVAIAIVGARRATAYGQDMAGEMAGELARRGVTIVSGLARGIDGAAHQGALQAAGRTVAVLGCGLDTVYPPEHGSLAKEVERAGALLSEFPVGTPPVRLNFPRRNRIISGLSLGVVVVEAGIESGALITAHHALEQGREVFAVPGRVHARYSEGCHRLIKAGAKLVESWEDVLAELVPQLKRGRRLKGAAAPLPPLTAEELRVYDLLALGSRHIDVLIGEAGLPGGRVASVLVTLEMKGVVRQLGGKVFERLDIG
ncbi:MAG: DNA-protecting protein DprA [candidate division NC10 bacterium]|nr:DNA-protecting protein DprA [candidate division NC10 bacterium]